jgi:cytoskeletal protein RodZ
MSTETPRAQSSRKRTMIIGAAIVVLLAVIAIVVASQAIRASEDAAAKDKSSVEASKPAQVTDGGKTTSPPQTTSPTQSDPTGQEAELVDEANTVCEMRLIEKYPTATIGPGTKSTIQKADGTFDTAGSYTDGGNSGPIPFECSSTRTDGSWTVVLKPARNG